ncbi:hypothetical protein AALP_AAs58361U000200 [Arabis alpina]|uniref:Uncharacterized protein n=1 Tax=Arabis alpina TaxID=50452 RepID=A0A087FWH3_ARAAL|nr:hypothetical protein AALP_AAs58361U000200 [Arabis alpina]
MHDFLERFGREIVRKRSILDPQQPQFLVDAGDICKVLNTDKVSHGSVIGAIINLSQIEDKINRNDIALERFSSLEFLRLYDDSYNSQEVRLVDYLHHHSRSTSKILNSLPRKVRLLDWRYLRMTRLPFHFHPELLVELKMQNNELEKLWRGIKPIKDN